MLSLETSFEEALLSRIEDAGLNASAPPQQRWVDGWLLRYSVGPAKPLHAARTLTFRRESCVRDPLNSIFQ